MQNENDKKAQSPLKRAFVALEAANRRLSAYEAREHESIAIVGIGCRFPGGASTPDKFWELLRDGRDVVSDIPPDRWDVSAYFDANPDTPGKMSVRRGAFIRDPGHFDAEFFGISPREAKSMDPQQRLLLEVSWEALENAGIPPDALIGTATGVFVGMCKNDYAELHRATGDPGRFGLYSTAGSAYSMASGRISYCLGLQGPSATIDTACSSSLVALHFAMQSLLQHESNLALAGGVNLILAPEHTISFSKAEMMSPDGRCKTFDAAANGFVQGEGCGVVVLKRLSDALAAEDNILAVVRGSAVNQDGPSSGLTAPNGAAQQDVIRAALARAGLSASDVDYIEAHGTGTSLGDPIEVRALAAVLGTGHTNESPLWVGSVKTNMGHLESAAGVASLIKVVLSMQHRAIPRHLHFQKPSSHIDWKNIPIKVPTNLVPWPDSGREMVAGVSSFGFSGTNVHLLISEAPGAERVTTHNASPANIFAISARDEPALDELCDSYRSLVAVNPIEDIAAFCRSVATGRSQHSARLAVAVNSADELALALSKDASKGLAERVRRATRRKNAAPRVAMLFTGQGSQYLNMGRSLFEQHTVFRAQLTRCSELLEEYLELPLLDVLFPQPGAEEQAKAYLDQTRFTQPALFSFEYALASLWIDWGVRPTAVMGHSIGEYVAACIAGAIELEDAIRLIAARGRLMQSLPAGGKMAAVFASHDRVVASISGLEKTVSIAAVNGPANIVISGAGTDIESVVSNLAKDGVDSQFLNVSHAFHSPLMRPILDEFKAQFKNIDFRKLKYSLISNVTGQSVRSDEIATAEYWLRHVELPVQFAASMQTLADRGCEIFVEVGPHPVLTTLGQVCLEDEALTWIHSMRRPTQAAVSNDWDELRQSLAQYFVKGGRVDWESVYAGIPNRKYSLPTYPFQRKRHWFDVSRVSPAVSPVVGHKLLGGRKSTPLQRGLFERTLARGDIEFIDAHVVHGQTIVPATAFLEMANVAGLKCGMSEVEIRDLTLLEALHVPETGSVDIQTILGGDGRFRVFSRRMADEWALHCEASLAESTSEALRNASAGQDATESVVSSDEFYAGLTARGLQFGSQLTAVSTISRQDGLATACIEVPQDVASELADYRFHPALLDACVQPIAAAIPGYRHDNHDGDIYLPFSIERCISSATRSTKLVSQCAVRESASGAETLLGDVRVFDENDMCVAILQGIRMKRISQHDLIARDPGSWYYETGWKESKIASSESTAEIAWPESDGPAALGTSFENLASTHFLQRYLDGIPKLERICTGYIRHALSSLGWNPSPGDKVDATVLGKKLQVVNEQSRLLNRFLQILVDEGLLEDSDGHYIVKRSLDKGDPSGELDALESEWPDGEAEIQVVRRCGPHLAAALTGKADPLELLFPRGNTEAGAGIYTRSPLAQVFNATVASAIDMALQSLAGKRPLRILEIGGGTGGTTRFIADRIDMDQLNYTFTDIGALFVTRAAERFADYGSMRFEVLDIERDLASQGFSAGDYDLIVAANIVHATTQLANTLEQIRKLLASSGLLLMTEVVARQNWIDITFGMTSGWWHFQDTDLRKDYPLLDGEQWPLLLEKNGFKVAENVPAATNPDCLNTVLVAQRKPAATESVSDTVSKRRWVVFGDSSGAADVFIANSAGHASIHNIDRQSLFGGKALVDSESFCYDKLLTSGARATGILFFWPMDVKQSTVSENSNDATKSLLDLVQSLVRNNFGLADGLWIVTSGAVSTAHDNVQVQPFQATSRGLGKVIGIEHPELNLRLVDIDPAAKEHCLPVLARLMLEPGKESDIAIRRHGVLVPRLVRVRNPDDVVSVADGQGLRLGISERGRLDNLVYQPVGNVTPGPREVRIRVQCSGLNFRDVLNALGEYAGGDVPFGSECAGYIASIGEGVEGFSIGDEVVAIAEHAMADYVTAKSALTVRKPKELPWSLAACLPIAFVTAHYCLHQFGSVASGERVLVHAGAGGVGLATIQLALASGAVVYATAGSPEKRAYLERIGVRKAFDSRSLEFSKQLLDETNNEGVDIVINSLANEFIPASLATLGHGGRFIEIGRSGIWSPEQVATARDDVRYVAVDLSGNMLEPDDDMRHTLESILAKLASGEVSPLPVTTFSRDKTEDAFRFMAQARHVGKIAIESPSASLVTPRSTYLVTGAFKGLGLLVSRWLADNGAEAVIMVGRTPPGEDCAAVVRHMESGNAHVSTIVADVTDRAALQSVFERATDEGRTLRGIVHCAGQLADAPIAKLTWEDFATVFSAKVTGTWLLHELSKDLSLDYFVTFSSIASILGSAGQANHCAANAFVDALADYRRQSNLPAININWGVWADTGAAVDYGVTEKAEGKGLQLIDPAAGLVHLERLLRSRRTQTMVQAVDWRKYVVASPQAQSQSLLAEVVARLVPDGRTTEPSVAQVSVHGEIQNLPESGRRQFVLSLINSEVIRVLGLDPETVLPEDLPLKDAGLDSLLAVELRNAISGKIEEKLPATLMFDYPTILDVTGYVHDLLFEKNRMLDDSVVNPASADTDLEQLFESIEGLSEDEADQLYRTRLQDN